jgi:uncharacterized protein YbjT (DUF2867 family)
MVWLCMLTYDEQMKMLVFGFGYTASHISSRLRRKGYEIVATVRARAKADELDQAGITADAAGKKSAPGLVGVRDPDGALPPALTSRVTRTCAQARI